MKFFVEQLRGFVASLIIGFLIGVAPPRKVDPGPPPWWAITGLGVAGYFFPGWLIGAIVGDFAGYAVRTDGGKEVGA